MFPILREFFVRQFRLGSETGPLFLSGTGSPEGVVTAPVGSRYSRTDGGTNTATYRKETGTGSTGWVADAAGGGGGGTPGGADTQIQFNNAGAFGGNANFTYNATANRVSILGTDPELELGTITTEPAAPAAGRIYVYAKDVAGQVVLKRMSPSGVDSPIQDSLSFNGFAKVSPGTGTGTTTATQAMGNTTFTNAGTLANPTPASTNLATSVRRTTFSSGATAGTVALHRQNALIFWRGNAAGLGGFRVVYRFALDTLQAGMRAFAGISDVVTSPTNVDPTTSTTPGKIGFAINTNTGNWNLVHNVTGTAPTVIALGAGFPVNTTAMLELVLYCAPNGTAIGYRVTNMSVFAQTSGSLTTNIPANTTFLAPVHWITNNATAAAAIMSFYGWAYESDT